MVDCPLRNKCIHYGEKGYARWCIGTDGRDCPIFKRAMAAIQKQK